MFTVKPTTEESELNKAITDALKQLDSVPAYSDEYTKIVNQITALNALKSPQTPRRVSPDVLATVLGNIVVALVVVEFERAGVVTSKALQFLGRAAR